MRALNPVGLAHSQQVSPLTPLSLPRIPSPTTKCAPDVALSVTSARQVSSLTQSLSFATVPQARQHIPPKQVREGKIASAWFLEQTGVKGLRKGDIQVAAYHANLIYNDGHGTASDLVWVINELKRRVRDHFGFDIEEEVQYIG